MSIDMSKKRPVCEECLRDRRKEQVLTYEELRTIFPNEFTQKEFQIEQAVWNSFISAECSLCREEENKKGERLEFKCTEDGSFVHKACLQKYSEIKLSCGHTI